MQENSTNVSPKKIIKKSISSVNQASGRKLPYLEKDHYQIFKQVPANIDDTKFFQDHYERQRKRSPVEDVAHEPHMSMMTPDMGNYSESRNFDNRVHS